MRRSLESDVLRSDGIGIQYECAHHCEEHYHDPEASVVMFACWCPSENEPIGGSALGGSTKWLT